MKMFMKSLAASAVAMGLWSGAEIASAASYNAIQDTYQYEFLGNQADATGDSGGISVWNHENVHGAQALIQFDGGAVTEAAGLGVGNYTATLNLYSACVIGGFIGACAGDDGTTVNTDVVLQGSNWAEDNAALAWGDITQSSSPFATLTQTSANASGWLSVDVTTLVDAWTGGLEDFGFALTQEAYSVVRTSSGSLAVSTFCDSESSSAECASGTYSPYLEISSVSAVPVPAAVWMLSSGLIGLVTVARRRSASRV
jgi:hypothetical protein